eukprot:TRINITY_DN5316_c0_g1_i1.p1 TRINITY_DN5316_c0_g1~~TRINITY_DN5316_c0_g1_i1.p1  ORF type:complete len:208 (+),score=82.32 TRINITY_DN5316_c0_g1_i1:84-626(+)
MPRAEPTSALALIATAAQAGPSTVLLLRAAGEPVVPVCRKCGWGKFLVTFPGGKVGYPATWCPRCPPARAGPLLAWHMLGAYYAGQQQQQQQQQQAAAPALELPDSFVLCVADTPPQVGPLQPPPLQRHAHGPPHAGQQLPPPPRQPQPPRRFGAAGVCKVLAASCGVTGLALAALRARR